MRVTLWSDTSALTVSGTLSAHWSARRTSLAMSVSEIVIADFGCTVSASTTVETPLTRRAARRWLIDLILTLAGVQRDKAGRLLPDFAEHKTIAWIITAAGFGLWLVVAAVSGIFEQMPDRFWPMMPWWYVP